MISNTFVIRDFGVFWNLKTFPKKRKFVRKFLAKIINLYEIKIACSRHFVKKFSADITEFFTKGENLNLTLTLKKGTISYANLRLRSRLVTYASSKVYKHERRDGVITATFAFVLLCYNYALNNNLQKTESSRESG